MYVCSYSHKRNVSNVGNNYGAWDRAVTATTRVHRWRIVEWTLDIEVINDDDDDGGGG